MLNRFAIFLLISVLLSGVVVAQDPQPQTPPATQNPSAQVPQTPQQQPSSTEPIADPPKDASPQKTEPGRWRKIKVVPARKPKQIPPGTLDKGTPA